jgi:hypothetical protein
MRFLSSARTKSHGGVAQLEKSTIEVPAQAAHREATIAPIAEIAGQMQQLLGQRVVAYATGMRSPKAVGRWLTGTTPHHSALKKLRDLYRTVLILGERYEPETICAWLEGANPELGDSAPIELLRQGRDVDVFRAAEDFVNQ